MIVRRPGRPVWGVIAVAVLAGWGWPPVLPQSTPPGVPPALRLAPGAPIGALPRIGVNLGGRSAWGAEQLMANVLRNPGLEALSDGALVVVGRISDGTVFDDNRWTARPAGFWAGAGFEVLSGAAAGQRGRVLGNQRPSDREPDGFTLAPLPAGLQPSDVIAVQGDQDPAPAPTWWSEGALQARAEPRPGSPGRRSVRLAAKPGQPAALYHHLDSIGHRAGKLLPVQGRWRLVLWLRAEADDTRVRLSFGRQGRADWLARTLTPAPGWQRIELSFDTQDDGPPGSLMLALRVERGAALVDDVELGAAAPNDTDTGGGAPVEPGGFRPEVVDTLRALRPGYLRDWQGQLADTPANRSAEPLARQPMRYRPGAHEMQFGHALPEFLALAAEVGARPWVVLPATSTPAQARDFGRALAEGWRRHRFDEIVVEHGNEHWNSVFRPAGIASAPVLAAVADRAFAALREGAGPAVPLHRVIGTQFVDGAAAGRMAGMSRHSEGVAVAPYFHYRQQQGTSTHDALASALHEGALPLQQAVAGAAAQGKSVDVYEVNFHTTGGSALPAERDAVLATPGAGAALMRRLLQAATLGVQRQAVYTLAGFDSFTSGEPRGLVQLFGITRDLAGVARWRPTGEAVVALNQVMGGTAQALACEGADCAELTGVVFSGRESEGRETARAPGAIRTRWALVSSAPHPVGVSLACSGSQRWWASGGRSGTAACEGGRVTMTLPARSWLTAAPV